MGCCHPKHVPVLPVQCPPNYDQAAFQKICRLFALLDKDSNFGVDIDEVSTVADLYCQNRSRIITEKLTALDRDFHAFEQSNTLSMNNELASCKALYNERAENFRLNIESRKRALTKKQTRFNSSSTHDKCKMFVEAVTRPGETQIDFWSFFEYMKTRIDDVENLTEQAAPSPPRYRRKSIQLFS